MHLATTCLVLFFLLFPQRSCLKGASGGKRTTVLNEGNKKKSILLCFALNTENESPTNWQSGYKNIVTLLMTQFINFFIFKLRRDYNVFYSTTSKYCQHLPLSSFSSLLISMTTNFSQTANVGKVEEMNCPNLDVYRKNITH